MGSTHPALLSTSAAARVLGIRPNALSKFAAEGKLVPAARTAGGHYRWDIDDLRRQVDRRRR